MRPPDPDPDPDHDPGPDTGGDRDPDGLDVDALFAEIVSRWEPAEPAEPADRVEGADPAYPVEAADPVESADPAERAGAADGPGTARSDAEPPTTPEQDPGASWHDEGHFVPPAPPPLPTLDLRRRLAWWGLLGTPVAAVLLVVLNVALPRWGAVLLAAAFVGGFGYLVTTMRSGPPDDWSGDDGAVV